MTENDEVYKFTHSEPDGRSSLLYKGARDGDWRASSIGGRVTILLAPV